MKAFCYIAALVASASLAAAATESTWIAVLQSDAAVKEKADACRELAQVGTADAVPVLAALLENDQLSSRARLALQAMPDAEAGLALRAALDRIKGVHLAGVIASVGARRDTQAVPALTRLLAESDPAVAGAAAGALGRIANAAAANALLDSLPVAPPEILPAVAESGLACADRLEGWLAARRASRLRQAVWKSAAPEPIRLAALRSLMRNGGGAGVKLLLEQLRSDDPLRFALAIGVANELPDRGLTQDLAGELMGRPADQQVVLIKVLGERGDRSVGPDLSRLARDGSNVVRVAAVDALARLGDAGSLPLLVELVADADPAVAQAAQSALSGFPEGAADDAVIRLLDSARADVLRVAIGLAGQRRLHGAVPGLLRLAGAEDPALGLAALKVLSDLAGSADVPALIRLLSHPAAGPATESALLAACTRVERSASQRIVVKKAVYGDLPAGPQADVTEKVTRMVADGDEDIEANNGNFGDPAPDRVKQLQVDFVADGRPGRATVREGAPIVFPAPAMSASSVDALCEALGTAAPGPRLALLRVLRSSGDSRALAAVRAATRDPDAAVSAGALRLLCDWPSAEARTDVEQLARTSADPKLKVLALRGLIRLTAGSDLAPAQKAAGLGEALALAERPDERLLIISALGAVPCAESLALLKTLQADAALREAATLAISALAGKVP